MNENYNSGDAQGQFLFTALQAIKNANETTNKTIMKIKSIEKEYKELTRETREVLKEYREDTLITYREVLRIFKEYGQKPALDYLWNEAGELENIIQQKSD